MSEVVAIFGPTGVGKTDVAIALARRLNERRQEAVAVSADALQIYRGLETLTGVASPEQQALLEHRLVSFVPIDRTFSVGEYSHLAHPEIDGLLADGKAPMVVGGTGLYLRAALARLDLRPSPPPELRERLAERARSESPEVLHAELAAVAPWAAAEIAPTDTTRVIRSLELHEMGELRPRQDSSQLWTHDTRHPTRLYGLTMEREALTERIDRRVDEMVAAGVIEEVRAADAAGASTTARKALGFDDLLADDVDAMKKRTRAYARRQLTWMRKLAGVVLVDITGRSPDEVAADIDSPP